MADIQLLGLFHDVGQTAKSLEQLRKLGISDQQITVLSNTPYNPEILGRPKHKTIIGRFALIGAILGLVTAVTLVAGSVYLYPLSQGNQPNVPIPPTLIVAFELTMLGTMWAAFAGLLFTNFFPVFKPRIYSPQITEDSIGVVVEMDEKLTEEIETVFKKFDAHLVQKEPGSPQTDRGARRFWTIVVQVLAFAGVIGGLLAYDVIHIPFPSNMVDQESIGFQQGPRLTSPLDSVPVAGLRLVSGEPYSAPVAPSSDSLQRGKILYSLNCELCHGAKGAGDGQISKYFDRKPADLTSASVQNLRNDDIYMVIMQGYGTMLPLAENLDRQDGWDVINYVHTLK